MPALALGGRDIKTNAIIAYLYLQPVLAFSGSYPDVMGLSMASDIGQSLTNDAQHLVACGLRESRERGEITLACNACGCLEMFDLFQQSFRTCHICCYLSEIFYRPACPGQRAPCRLRGILHNGERAFAVLQLQMCLNDVKLTDQPDHILRQCIVKIAGAQSGPELDTVVMVKVRDTRQAMQTLQAVEQALTQAHVKVTDASLHDTTSGELAINGMLIVIRVLALIALLLTGMLIINTITVLVTEQMRIIGTMKAIGGTRWVIMQGYLISVGVYSLVGTILGLVAGIGAGNQLAAVFAGIIQIDLGHFQVSPWILVVSILAGLLLPPLAALAPLWQGTRITVREAMAGYGVSVGSGKQRAWGQRLAWVPQTAWLGVRGIFRKRMRAILTVLALTLSCAVFMSVQITTSSIGYTLDQWANAYTNDLTAQWGSIKYRPGIYEEMIHQVQALANVDRVEPRTSGTVNTRQGDLSLTGLEAQTQFYQYHLVAGRWLAASESNTIVISDLAATTLHLRVGDTLTLTEDMRQATWRVVGIVHDLQASGGIGEAFTTLENMNVHLLRLPADSMMMLMVRAHNHAENAVNQLAGQVNSTLSSLGVQAQVTTLQEMTAQAQSVDLMIYVLFYSIAIIVALIGLLCLFSTISSSVLERRLELGILRALGAKGRRVANVFSLESTALALFAWGMGTLLGIPGAYGIIRLLSALIVPFDFLVPPVLILTTFGFVMVVTLLASVGPALRASRLQLREVLHYE